MGKKKKLKARKSKWAWCRSTGKIGTKGILYYSFDSKPGKWVVQNGIEGQVYPVSIDEAKFMCEQMYAKIMGWA